VFHLTCPGGTKGTALQLATSVAFFPRSAGLSRDTFGDNSGTDLQAGMASTKNVHFLKLTSVQKQVFIKKLCAVHSEFP